MPAIVGSSIVKTYSSAYMAENSSIPSYCIGEVIVLLKSGLPQEEFSKLLDKHGFAIKASDPFVEGQYIVSIGEKDGAKTIDASNLLYQSASSSSPSPTS